MIDGIVLQLRGGADPHRWSIIDQEGRELRGVVAVTVRADASSGEPARCTLDLVHFDFDAEIAAVARRFGLAPRPLYARDWPWWVNAMIAADVWVLVGLIAWWSL